MTQPISRRRFFGTSTAVASTAIAATGLLFPAPSVTGYVLADDATSNVGKAFRTKIHKAVICSEVTDEVLEPLKKTGFEGVETTLWNTTPEKAAAARLVAEKHGMRIHSVMRGWAEFNHE
ncbi:MAG: hypothetical protein FWC50_02460, partial [Planctomycetaceae bacterium]|nr:hypothetical protein [Planctomycetaceae bacterium]